MILLESLVRRWYAFGFLAAFLWAASAERGWRKALRFLGIATVASFMAEYLSTHYGLPYGWYRYIGATRGDELYVSNVPLFVPVTFGVAVWAGRAIAQSGLRARTPGQLVLGGALAATVLDLVIDPMTLRGQSWFFGTVYEYMSREPYENLLAFPLPYQGGWFDVPWSNYAGWFVVAAVILWIDELFEWRGARRVEPVRGVTLAAFICVFFTAVAFATRHWAIAVANVLVSGAIYAATAANVRELVASGEEEPV